MTGPFVTRIPPLLMTLGIKVTMLMMMTLMETRAVMNLNESKVTGRFSRTETSPGIRTPLISGVTSYFHGGMFTMLPLIILGSSSVRST